LKYNVLPVFIVGDYDPSKCTWRQTSSHTQAVCHLLIISFYLTANLSFTFIFINRIGFQSH